MITPFDSLPDSARIWIYAADSRLDGSADALLLGVRRFLSGWTSHGLPVYADAFVEHDRFLVIGGFVPDGDLSGCGIDFAVHEVTRLAQQVGIRWADGLSVGFRDDSGHIQIVDRPTFRAKCRAGAIHADTVVFDFGGSTVAEWRSGRFERPARDSWHARVFGLSRAA